jgi:hypothetical protein
VINALVAIAIKLIEAGVLLKNIAKGGLLRVAQDIQIANL